MMCGIHEIEAETLEDAIAIAQDKGLPVGGYIDGSYEVGEATYDLNPED